MDEILNAMAERRDVEYVVIDAHRLVGAALDYAGSGVRIFDVGWVDQYLRQ